MTYDLLRFANRVLNNLVVDFIRSAVAKDNKIENFKNEGKGMAEIGAAKSPVNEAIESKERRVRIRTALENLDETTRQLVVGRFFDGIKFKDLSAKYGMPIATIASKINAALPLLKKHLEE